MVRGNVRVTITSLLLCCAASPGCADAPTPQDGVKLDVAQIAAEGAVRSAPAVASAGQPDAAAFKAIAEAGYGTVIDLRTEAEDRGLDEPKALADLGMRYVSLPIAGEHDINFENAATLDALIGEANGPVLVHCASGNRVGALLALRTSLQGADDDTAIAAGKAAGLTRLEPIVRKRLSEKAVRDPLPKN